MSLICPGHSISRKLNKVDWTFVLDVDSPLTQRSAVDLLTTRGGTHLLGEEGDWICIVCFLSGVLVAVCFAAVTRPSPFPFLCVSKQMKRSAL